jgi:hypothetical protein
MQQMILGAFIKDGCLLASWKAAGVLAITLLRKNLDFVKRML